MTAKSRKFIVLAAYLSLIGITIAFPKSGFAQTPNAVSPKSAAEFWAEVNNITIPEGSTDKIIFCGPSSLCNNDEKCVSRTTTKADTLTDITDAGQKVGLGTAIIGTALAIFGSVTAPVTFGTSLSLTAVGSTMLGAGTLMGGASWAVQQSVGTGTQSIVEYKCIAQNEEVPSDWKEETEGGVFTEIEIDNEGWFTDASITNVSCYSAKEDTKKYCLVKSSGSDVSKTTVTYGNTNTAFQKCEVLPVKLYNNRRCFFCGLFSVVYTVSNKMTSISFNALAKGFALVIAMGLAIWIAVQTLGQVASITKQDAPKFLTSIIKQSYKFMIAFFLLQYSSQIFVWGVVPVIEAGIKFGASFLGEDNITHYAASDETTALQLNKNNPGIYERTLKAVPDSSSAYYPRSLYINLDNFVARIQQKLSTIQSIGGSLICIGKNALILRGQDLKFGDGFILMIEGIILAVYGFLLSLAFAFYLLDAIVQLGIVGALMPFLIASWPFKITSKYASTGWNMILNSAFIFMFAGFLVSVNINLISSAINFTATENSSSGNSSSSNADTDVANLYTMAKAINSQSEPKVKQQTDISSTGFITLILCCYFGFMLMNKVSELAGKFASGASKSITPQIATIAGSAIKSSALKLTQHTRDAAGEKLSSFSKKVTTGLAYPILHPQKSLRNVKNFLTGNKERSATNATTKPQKENLQNSSPSDAAQANKNQKQLSSRQKRKELARKAQQAGSRKQAQSNHSNKPKGRSKKNRHRKNKNKHRK